MTEQSKVVLDRETTTAYVTAASQTGDTTKYPVGTRLVSAEGIAAEVVAADGANRTVRAGGKDRVATVAQIDVLIERGTAKLA